MSSGIRIEYPLKRWKRYLLKFVSLTLRDNAHGRILGTEKLDDDTLTVESCISFCQAGNFTLTGVEFGVQCCT